jgi:hypothetical protein
VSCHVNIHMSCHVTKLTPQDDMSCHVNIHVSCHVNIVPCHPRNRWSMVGSTELEKCFHSQQMVDGRCWVNRIGKEFHPPFENVDGRWLMVGSVILVCNLNKITQRDISNELLWMQNRARMRKLQVETVKVKFWHQFTSRGHNSLLRSLFGAQE